MTQTVSSGTLNLAQPTISQCTAAVLPVHIPAFAGTYCAYPRKDRQAELTWPAWSDAETVNHTTINHDIN